MPTQAITVVALPNGFASDGRLRLTVSLAPRLSGASTLSQFPDFSDFPTIAASMHFDVSFGGGPAIRAVPATGTPVPQSALWQAILPGTTQVMPFTFDPFTGRTLRSYPAANVSQFLQGVYTAIGLQSGVEFPSTQTLLSSSALGSFAVDDSDDRGLKTEHLVAEIQGMLDQNGGVIPPAPYSPQNVATDMFQVRLLNAPRRTDPTGSPVPDPTIDFHQVIGLLGSHPALMRRLGLMRDLVVDPPLGFFSSNQPSDVSVTVSWTPAPTMTTTMVTTRTRYLPQTFFAAPRSTYPQVAGRRLRLSDPPYDVVDFDLDGAALKTIGLAASVLRASNENRSTPSTPTSYSMPALRSEGLVLVKAGKAAEVQATLARQNDLNTMVTSGTPSTPVFDAEDLIRGYYVDVWDSHAGHWSPLCARHVSYRAGSLNPIEVEDEGPITLAITSQDEGATADLLVPEVVAKWGGWSAVAPRPGKVLAADPAATEPLADQPNTDTATNIDLGMTISTPLDPTRPKLPSLRYGRTYRLRARAADLAGNADLFDPSPPSEPYATTAKFFGRYDPVPAPVVLPREDFGPGASAHRLVIRSNYADPIGHAGTTSRHIAPPRASEQVVEYSGELDDSTGRISDALATYRLLASRDGTQPDGTLPTFDSSPLNTKHPDPSGPGTGSYIFPGDWLVVPYLPDPFSRGVGLARLPFGTNTTGGVAQPGGYLRVNWRRPVETGFEGATPVRMVLREPATITTTTDYLAKVVPASDGIHQEISVYLPKGSVATIRVSSVLTPDGKNASGAVVPSKDVIRLGLWQWLILGANGTPLTSTQQANLRALIAAGLHWMMTPFEEVTLVHAVRQPLLPPRWATAATLTGYRAAGETRLTLSGDLTCSVRSTGRVLLHADWTEQYDDPSEPTPGVRTFRELPHSYGIDSVNAPLASGGKPLPPAHDPVNRTTASHELHDQRHRTIGYTLEAVSSFAEEFVETSTLTPGTGAVITLADQPLIPGYTRVVDAGTGQVFESGVDYQENDPAPGRISIPTGSPIALDQPVTCTFLAGPISRSSTEPLASGETGVARIAVNVLATARPKAPVVAFVIPAYSWSGWATTSSNAKNTRTGNIVRVWLDRPWFTSGDGEKLAVIVASDTTVQPDAQDTNGLHQYVTLVGADPIWGDTKWTYSSGQPGGAQSPSGPTRTGLTTAQFPLATQKIASGIVLDTGQTVGAAIHEVTFDPDRNRWFCDIQVDPGAAPYTPFVRLALARWQPNALTDSSQTPALDLRTSHVVAAEIAQLSPTRSATLTFSSPSGSNPSGLAVSVTGLSYLSTGQYRTQAPRDSHKGPSYLECQVQVLRPGMDPAVFPDTAWVASGGPQRLAGTITSAGMATWSLPSVKLPSARGSQPMRLVFTEYEQMYTDGGSGALGRVVFTATYRL